MADPVALWPDKNHPYYEDVHDTAQDVAQEWMDELCEDNEFVMELIEDAAAKIGLTPDRVEFDEFDKFFQSIVYYARLRLVGMLVEEATTASPGVTRSLTADQIDKLGRS